MVKVEGTLVEREDASKKFMTDIDFSIQLRHPNICVVYGVITTDSDTLKVIMDHAPDDSLRELLDQNTSEILPNETQMSYIKQLCNGLKYLHGSNAAHWDFKSLNVLRKRKQDKFLITDFGLSREMDKGVQRE